MIGIYKTRLGQRREKAVWLVLEESTIPKSITKDIEPNVSVGEKYYESA